MKIALDTKRIYYSLREKRTFEKLGFMFVKCVFCGRKVYKIKRDKYINIEIKEIEDLYKIINMTKCPIKIWSPYISWDNLTEKEIKIFAVDICDDEDTSDILDFLNIRE
jgi:hypothetical protein